MICLHFTAEKVREMSGEQLDLCEAAFKIMQSDPSSTHPPIVANCDETSMNSSQVNGCEWRIIQNSPEMTIKMLSHFGNKKILV